MKPHWLSPHASKWAGSAVSPELPVHTSQCQQQPKPRLGPYPITSAQGLTDTKLFIAEEFAVRALSCNVYIFQPVVYLKIL